MDLMIQRCKVLLAAGLLLLTHGVAFAAEQGAAAPVAKPKIKSISIEPSELTLHDGADQRMVLVSGTTADGKHIDLTGLAALKANSKIIEIGSDGYLIPKAAGTTSVTVSYQGLTQKLSVKVIDAKLKPAHFAKDVMPVLAKVGCNAGTCHGAEKGRNGFFLSLRGFDPAFDYLQLTNDLSGRRFNRVEPAQSLMLLKMTAEVPHEGQQVIAPGGRRYQTVLRWIQGGAKYANDDASRVAKIEVSPKTVFIEHAGQNHRVMIQAHYADGSSRDVTRESVISSSDTEVATMTDNKVTALRRGEAAVLVRYEGMYASVIINVMGDRAGWQWPNTPEFNYIDKHVYNKLKLVKSQPSELCTDAEFARRLYLDLTGMPPSPDFAQAFVEDKTPSAAKRQALIEKLVGSSSYADFWANKWADLLQCNSKTLGERGMWVFRQWLTRSVAQNKPYDEFVRELISASGSTYRNPAANYMRTLTEKGQKPDVNKITEDLTQTFMGVRFSCNKCHNHPFEKWQQVQYYQFAAYFARLQFKKGKLPGEMVVYNNFNGGEVKHPKTGQPVGAIVPFGKSGKMEFRRDNLAQWLTAKDNPFFAKSYVNRVWSYFNGRGIIEPVDDIRASNPPTNVALLDAMTKRFIDSGFDVNQLVRSICQSRTYQTSIKINAWNGDDKINYSHFYPRRLSAEQLLDAVAMANGLPAGAAGMPSGLRAIQMPDGKIKGNDFLELFGRPKRDTACECARTNNISLAHALNLVNGKTLGDAVLNPGNRLAKLVRENKDNRKVIEGIYYSTLSRPPTAEEYEIFDLGTDDKQRLEIAQDLMWALLNSPAFLFNR